MAGRKTFTAGEVLQAADVNDFLMDQSVMVFAGTAARGSAIPSPTEGMVTYRSDDDVVEVYTTDWEPVGATPAILEVVSVTKTDTFSASLAAGANTSVTGLSITHSMRSASNKLLITAFFGAAGSSADVGGAGIAVAAGGSLINIGDASGSHTRVTAGGRVAGSASAEVVSMPAITNLYSPGTTSSITYTVEVFNIHQNTSTVTVNTAETSSGNERTSATVSALTIMEVTG